MRPLRRLLLDRGAGRTRVLLAGGALAAVVAAGGLASGCGRASTVSAAGGGGHAGGAEQGQAPSGTASAPVSGGAGPASQTTGVSSSQSAALTSAIIAYQSQQGVERALYQIANVRFSTADPNWARFDIAASSPTEQFQGGYGIAHNGGGFWTVVAFGTAEVGCPPGPHVPPRVLASLGSACPAAS